jgi:hypothetical protein
MRVPHTTHMRGVGVRGCVGVSTLLVVQVRACVCVCILLPGAPVRGHPDRMVAWTCPA